ncbi:MAG: hypothetical protein IIC55_03740 [Proteobacteria bacterium]|nr:hypothetical protein [Pseudomonadota bacterium]
MAVSVRHRRGIFGGSVFGTLDDDIDAVPGLGNLLANLLPLRFRLPGLFINHLFLALVNTCWTDVTPCWPIK